MALAEHDGIEAAQLVEVTPPLRSRIAAYAPLLERTDRKEVGHGVPSEEPREERGVRLIKASGGHDRTDDSRTI